MNKGLLKSDKQYIPRFPEKYVGRYPIYIKSSWETKFAQWLDYNENVIEWSSESIMIRYQDPFEPTKYRRYFPDFYAKFKDGKSYIIEIKPLQDCKLPTKKSKASKKTLLIREHTYHINNAKFKAAKEYAKKMGMVFEVITEKDLFRKK
jgi:hypothetical protein